MSVLNHLYGLRRAVGLMALLTGLAGNSHAQAPDPLSSWNDGGAKATHRCFIVLSGGIEFMRPWTERVYGIPPEQVVGSSGGLKYELCDWQAGTREAATLVLHNDKEGKPVGIQRHIGRRRLVLSATPMATSRCRPGPPARRAHGWG